MSSVQTMRDIAIEALVDNPGYAWGNYGDFRVLIMLSNGYINVTKMCKEGGKPFPDWKKLKESNELMSEVESAMGIPIADLLRDINSGDADPAIRGTYAHPKLVPYIAFWVSPKFAIRVVDIVNEYFAREARLEKSKLEAKNADLTVQLADMIRRYDEECVKAILANCEAIAAKNAVIVFKEQSDAFEKELVAVKREVINVKATNELLNEKITIVAGDRVPSLKDFDKNIIFMLLATKDSNGKDLYHISRAQRKTSMSIRFTDYDDWDLLMFEQDPSPGNLLIRVKERLAKKVFKFRYNDFTPIGEVTRQQVIDHITRVRDEKYDV